MSAIVQSVAAAVDASTNSCDITVASTTAGNLLVVWVKWEGADDFDGASDVVVTVTEGAGAFTGATGQAHANNDLNGRFFYKLAAAGGDTTITVALSANRPYKIAHFWEISDTGGAWTLDSQIATAQGNGQTVSSGNWTASADAKIGLGGLSLYGDRALNAGAQDINGVNADDTETAGTSAASWAKTLSAGFTGDADASWSGTGADVDYLVHGISFNYIASGGAALRRYTASLLGVG